MSATILELPGVRRRAGAGPRLALLGVGALLVAAVAVLLALDTTTTDYRRSLDPGSLALDNPAPSFAALLHGDLAGFAHRLPALGLTSIVLRAPFVAANHLAGGGFLAEYRVGSLACLLVAAVVALVIARLVLERGGRPLAAAAVAVVALANPLSLLALRLGHPEELLCGALSVGAVLAAGRGRPTLAAVALGLAMGTKQWVVVAVPAVALALPARERLRTAGITTAVAALMVLPGPLLSAGGYHASTAALTQGHMVSGLSLWWPVSVPRHVVLATGAQGGYPVMPLGLNRRDAMLVLLVVAAALTAVAARHRPPGAAAAPDLTTGLRLLAALMLARFLLDPYALSYYGAPLVFSLAAVAAVEPVGGLLALLAGVGLDFGYGAHTRSVTFLVTVCCLLPVAWLLARPPRPPARRLGGRRALSRAA